MTTNLEVPPTAEELTAELDAFEEGVQKDKRKRHRRVTVRRWILVLAVAIGMALGAYDIWVTTQSSKQLQVIQNLSALNLRSQNAHHAQTNKKNDQLAQAQAQTNAALAEVKEEAAAIEYEGGVITYLLDEVKQGQAQGYAQLTLQQQLQQQLTADEQQLKTALLQGQAQINAAINYNTCLGQHPNNQAVCGPQPPLPSTNG